MDPKEDNKKENKPKAKRQSLAEIKLELINLVDEKINNLYNIYIKI